MLTRPRLSIFEPHSVRGRLKHSLVERIFGFYPAAIHVLDPVTRMRGKAAVEALHAEGFRSSSDWTRPELELLGAFVSSRNGCVF